MSKIRKFIKNPNLFFYDFFRKRMQNTVYKNKIGALHSDAELLEISEFQSHINDITDFVYKGRRYIHNKEKFIYLLHRLSLSKCTIRIVCKFFAIYSDAISLEELFQKLKNTSNCYIELCKVPFFISLDIVFTTFKDNIYHSNGDARKVSIYNLNEIYKDHYDFDVDVVYTYVDSKDEQWGNAWKKYFGEENFDPERYASHDELKYSLRSLNQFMPWIRKIYIVSNCAKPKWLNENERIIWVDHTSIFPSQTDLPNFNSHAIESCLHRIKNLGERFIYFNDDVLLNKSVYKSDFFNSAGMSINFREPYEVAFWTSDALQIPAGYQHAAINGQNILYRDFGYTPRYMMQHTPHSVLKSVLQNMETRYFSLFEEVRRHKIRSIDDISPLSFFYPHYAFLMGKSEHKTAKCTIIRESNYAKIIKRNHQYTFLCFNSWHNDNTNFYEKTLEFFETRYLVKPEWENED